MAIITGTPNDDILPGTPLADDMFGLDGDDTLLGSLGADLMNGGDGTDTVDYSGSSGSVFVDLASGFGSGNQADGDTYISIENAIGSDFGDTLVGSSTVAGRLTGGLGDDVLANFGADGTVLDGGEGADFLVAFAGDTTMIGGLGADIFLGAAAFGNPGESTVDFSGASAPVQVDLELGVGTLGEADGDQYIGINSITGSDFDDVLTASSTLAGTISGGKGNDTLKNGGALTGGADGTVLDGGLGNDTLISYGGETTMIGGRGADRFYGSVDQDTVDFSDASAWVYVDLTRGAGFMNDSRGDFYQDIDNITGSDFNDILVASSSLAGTISGGKGNDTLKNGGAATGGADGTVLDGGVGNDTLISYGGETTMIGGRGADRFLGGADQDTADFSGASAWVYVDLERGKGFMNDSSGDTYSRIDNVTGSDFNDILVASSKLAGTISGGKGNDTLKNGGAATGGADGTILDGGEGNDTLLSYGGDTTMDGGVGTDKMVGGSGLDVFEFELGDGTDVINNFQDGTDLISFGTVGLNFGSLTITDTASGANVDYGGDSILVTGVAASSLDAGDFLFA